MDIFQRVTNLTMGLLIVQNYVKMLVAFRFSVLAFHIQAWVLVSYK